MTPSLLLVTPRSASFEIANGHPFRSPGLHRAMLSGAVVYEGERNVFTIHGLRPGTAYSLTLESGGAPVQFRTAAESFCVDVRAFGAVGDGRTDDTAAIQAAISSCPAGGTVMFPDGTWLSAPVFLKSDIDLQLARGSRLLGHPDVGRWPILPGIIRSHDGTQQAYLGSWEGHPHDCHAGLITAIDVSNVRIHGGGSIDGNASFETWWSRPKQPFRAWRPRTVFAVGCRSLSLAGLALRNSPSWTIHALFCRQLRCVDLHIEQPPQSPNTDGIDPESCEDVLIAGVHCSTGDDCIALKSGKAWIAARSPVPTRNVTIANCRMQHGHGAIVIGSEMAGGVYDVLVRDCLFEGTDRGLRIKTRRGRGSHAVVDGVHLRNVHMRSVGTPIVVNSFYCPDPGGSGPREDSERDASHVSDRAARPMDEGTPALRNIHVTDVSCEGVAHSAGYILGLPERPLENLSLTNYRVRFDPAANAGHPDMADFIPAVRNEGIHLCNVRNAVLTNVSIEGARGPAIRKENVS